MPEELNLRDALPHPLHVGEQCFGSDPVTHKKMREQATEPPENVSSTQSTSTTTSSSPPFNTQTKITDSSEQNSKPPIK